MQRVDHDDFHKWAIHAELLVFVRDLLARVKILEAENAQIKAESTGLREELRADKRATAPFSNGKGKANPMRPGRKPGTGLFTKRPEPQPAPSDIVEDIKVPAVLPSFTGLALSQSTITQALGKLETYRVRGLAIREELTYELRQRILKDRDNPPLLDGIVYQHRNARVLLFLERPEIEPTHNRAERGLRGGVIAHKVLQCSKNERGAGIYEVMKSITATRALRGFQVATTVAEMLTGKPMPKAPSR